MLREFLGDPSISRKDFFIVSTLLFNAFTWWYILPLIIDSVLSGVHVTATQTLITWVTYYVAIIGSSMIGSILPSKMSRLKLLYLWIILGVISSSLPAMLSSFSVTNAIIISVFLGASFGLGMPSCLAYLADCTLVENRGRISGIILLATNLSAPLLATAFSMFNLKENSIIFTLWRASGLVIYFLQPEEKIVSKIKGKTSFIEILHDKSFILYFSAWIMFMLISRFERPILNYFFGDFYYQMIAPIIGSLFAFIAGLLSDRIGRKRVILYGFVTLGIAYAIIGIAPATLISWYFFLTVESISIGILWVTFILILWGDISQSGTREKYYAIGETPFFFTIIIELFLTPVITFIPETSAFSLASFFLFLAVLPLLYAPETLPERKIELRQLRKYVETARKIKEKCVERHA